MRASPHWLTWALLWVGAVPQHSSATGDSTQHHFNNGLAKLPEVIPGGSPFSFCPQSSPSDLFRISSIQLWPQPLHIDDEFRVYIYGEFLEDINANSTFNFWYDCGSHCAEYGAEPGAGEGGPEDFCELTRVEQPNRRRGCPAEKGGAILSYEGWVVPMFFHVPLWYNFTFDVRTREDERVFCVTSEVCLKWRDEDKNEHYPGGPYPNCTWPR